MPYLGHFDASTGQYERKCECFRDSDYASLKIAGPLRELFFAGYLVG